MRIAVVSDLHGNLAALEAVAEDLERERVDLVVHGGDLVTTGPRPAEVLDRVRELGWAGVVGNTDEMLWDASARAEQERKAPRLVGWLHQLFETLAPWARERLGQERIDWLRRLPREWRSERLLVMHASPQDLWRAPLPDASDTELRTVFGEQGAELVVYGHIHQPYVRALNSGLTVANSGSVGLPYDGDWRASYLLLEDGQAAVRRVAYDLQRELADIRSAGFPLGHWLAESQRHGRYARPDPQA
jgi:putative phosphoesterase